MAPTENFTPGLEREVAKLTPLCFARWTLRVSVTPPIGPGFVNDGEIKFVKAPLK